MQATIFVALLDEGTDVWRPVVATPIGDNRYQIVSVPSSDEKWEFASGAIVRCETR
jgi:hypothetical protein